MKRFILSFFITWWIVLCVWIHAQNTSTTTYIPASLVVQAISGRTVGQPLSTNDINLFSISNANTLVGSWGITSNDSVILSLLWATNNSVNFGDPVFCSNQWFSSTGTNWIAYSLDSTNGNNLTFRLGDQHCSNWVHVMMCSFNWYQTNQLMQGDLMANNSVTGKFSEYANLLVSNNIGHWRMELIGATNQFTGDLIVSTNFPYTVIQGVYHHVGFMMVKSNSTTILSVNEPFTNNPDAWQTLQEGQNRNGIKTFWFPGQTNYFRPVAIITNPPFGGVIPSAL